MGERGRKSAASREVVKLATVQSLQRPDAPYELTDEQAQQWWMIVNSHPADWFAPGTHSMLAQLCRHIVESHRIAELIAAAQKRDDFSIKDYDRLLRMQEREGRAIGNLCTKMRLSQQSSYDRKKTKKVEPDITWSIRKSHRSDPVDS